jgi:hypothetical protein
MTDPMCKPPCDPSDPNCGGTCDSMTDPNCGGPCDPMTDPMCKPPCEPGDPNCGAPCDPMTDPNCPPPPPCDPSDPSCQMCTDADPNCKCDWWMGCEPVPPCDPMIDVMCPVPPPPCDDPTDPNTCKDPCMTDPESCGCAVAENGTMDPAPGDGMSCWPAPEPCTMESCPEDPWAPQHPPGDFGCEGDTN